MCWSIVEAPEHILHAGHPLDIRARLMIAAALAFRQFESAPGKLIAGPGAAEVDQRSQHLLLRERCRPNAAALENQRDASIEIRGGQLDRIAGYDPGVKTVEPAGVPIIPRAVGYDNVIVDAIAARLRKISIGNLIHADGTRCRP